MYYSTWRSKDGQERWIFEKQNEYCRAEKCAYQSNPSKSPSPLTAQVLKIAHWRLFILCNSKASVTAASSSAPGRSCPIGLGKLSNRFCNQKCLQSMKIKISSFTGIKDNTAKYYSEELPLLTCLFANMRTTAPFNSSSCKSKFRKEPELDDESGRFDA